jgi:hypothetical protein
MPSVFEHEVSELTQRVLQEYRGRLESVGLRTNFRGVIPPEVTQAGPWSEVSILIYRGNNLVDSLEFFVEKAGMPQVTLAEVETWLRKELSQLVADRISIQSLQE